jgi:hypothetical protein
MLELLYKERINIKVKITKKNLEKHMNKHGWTFWVDLGTTIKWYKKNKYWFYVAEFYPKSKEVHFWKES